mgnify:CR=1 FL=1|jgi:Phospholipase/lecithinase/hemolysin
MSLNRLLTRRVRRAALALCAAAVLSACGGGDRAEPYVPTQLLAYGDELSRIEANGSKYTVNGLSSTDATQQDCAINPIWVQILAADLGMAFEQCPSTFKTFAAINKARVGAKTTDVIAELAALRATNPGPSTLVTVLVGTYDVKDLYAQVKAGTLSLSSATTKAAQLGADLGAEIRRVTDAHIGIIVSTIPDLGQSPYALLPANGNDAKAIADLTAVFNEKLVETIPQSGRKVGLVYGRPIGLDLNGSPVEGYTNAGVCTVNVLDCTTSTLQSGGDINTWVWAADVYPTPMTHIKLGNNAATLVRNTLAPGQD